MFQYNKFECVLRKYYCTQRKSFQIAKAVKLWVYNLNVFAVTIFVYTRILNPKHSSTASGAALDWAPQQLEFCSKLGVSAMKIVLLTKPVTHKRQKETETVSDTTHVHAMRWGEESSTEYTSVHWGYILETRNEPYGPVVMTWIYSSGHHHYTAHGKFITIDIMPTKGELLSKTSDSFGCRLYVPDVMWCVCIV